MADITGVHLLRVAAHASNTETESTSESFVFLEPVGGVQHSFKVRKLERDVMRGDNEYHARIVGPDEPPTVNFTLPVRGLNGNTGGAVTAAKLTDMAPLLNAVFGVAGDGGTGSTVDATGSTTSVVRFADASGLAAGDGVLVPDGDGTLIGRYILSKSTNDATLSHTWSGAPTDDGQAYAGMTWYLDSDNPNHTHVAFDLEGSNWRRKAYGFLGDVTFDFPANGDYARAAFAMQGTAWEDSAEANPTFSAPTAGNEIPCISSTLWIADATSGGSTAATASKYLLRDLKITIAQTRAPKTTYSGVNGFTGYVVTKKTATIEGTLYLGALSQEAADSLLATFNGSTAQDLLIQMGASAGGTMLCRMPNADVSAELANVDGIDAIKFTARGARSGHHATVPGSFRMTLF